ncbi:hypothetical protein [Acidianus sp.]|uniref:hypothetical protein n=1 Tax=Acidianus sp. TaxID=1872104 RepID=UPI00397BC648
MVLDNKTAILHELDGFDYFIILRVFVTGNNESYEVVNELLSKRATIHSSLFQLKLYDITKDKLILTRVSDKIFKLDEYWGEDLLALAKLSYITQNPEIVKKSTEIMLNKLENIERQNGIKSETDVEIGMGSLKGLSNKYQL